MSIPYFLMICTLLVYADATHAQHKEIVSEQPCHISPKPELWLTVFVHGIMSVKHHLSFSNIVRLMQDNVEDSLYATTVYNMRNDPFFFKNQAMQELGLKEINPADTTVGNASSLLARLMDNVIKHTYTYPIENHFYTFGWSGLLSPSKRYSDAKKLYSCLVKELKKYTKMGITPHIRLIGYSHGGNICLNLAAITQHENIKEHMTIDQLILLGVPVQHDTDYLVCGSIFKKIYHFYSHADRIQQLDFFSWNRFLSKRLFKERDGFIVPQNLMQIRVKARRTVHDKKQMHKELTSDFTNPAILSGAHPTLKNADPGHAELWFFAWTPANYRPSFPLYPLPLVVFTPALIQYIEEAKSLLTFKDNILTIDLRPEHTTFFIKGKGNAYVQKPLLPGTLFDELKKDTFPIKPENYNQAAYNERVHIARQASAKK